MADRWYYAHGESRTGPCSGRQLMQLAACGQILPTDTVWKDGVEKGVPARKVRHLFPAVHASAAHAEAPSPAQPTSTVGAPDSVALAAPEAEPGLAESRTQTAPEETAPVGPEASDGPAPVVVAADAEPMLESKVPVPPSPPNWQQNQVRKGRATAGKGALIVGQDGVNVKYRKKCTTCGHQDTCCNSMPIRNGVTRVGFFCPKCKKNRAVEIQGSLN